MSSAMLENFGGVWTVKKLEILAGYLDAYTTALKNKSFSLVYIDAFAGDGQLRSKLDEEVRGFITGSPRIALKVENKPFDKLYFNELNRKMFKRLEDLERAYPSRVHIFNSDANEFTQSVLTQIDWISHRGVIFLDPFATEVKWETMKQIASFNALDTWVLFPISAVSRMLPTSKEPGEVFTQWVDRLNTIFGNADWHRIYEERTQGSLQIEDFIARDKGVQAVKQIAQIYKDRLKELFGARLLNASKTLNGPNNAPLFEFIFCAGHPKGIPAAHRIAAHIIDKI